jgi:hypothetical protein
VNTALFQHSRFPVDTETLDAITTKHGRPGNEDTLTSSNRTDHVSPAPVELSSHSGQKRNS